VRGQRRRVEASRNGGREGRASRAIHGAGAAAERRKHKVSFEKTRFGGRANWLAGLTFARFRCLRKQRTHSQRGRDLHGTKSTTMRLRHGMRTERMRTARGEELTGASVRGKQGGCSESAGRAGCRRSRADQTVAAEPARGAQVRVVEARRGAEFACDTREKVKTATREDTGTQTHQPDIACTKWQL
jgi:hypothetical protein